jgi:hypothetical protein
MGVKPSMKVGASAAAGVSRQPPCATMMAPVTPSRLRPPLHLVLALALLLASTLGLMHGSLHAPGLQQLAQLQQAGQADAPSGEPAAMAKPPLHGWLLKLFDHHEGAECRLYDQLSGSCSPPGVPPVVAILALPTAGFHFFLGLPPARPLAPFEARGPPPRP